MSLELYCRWGSTIECNYNLKKYLKNWGSNVVEVLLFLEFYRQHTSHYYIPKVFFFNFNRWSRYERFRDKPI